MRHWADDFTLRFLVYLAERVEDIPVAVVVAIRSGDPGAESQLIGDLWQAASVPPVRPAELSESAIAELLAAALPERTIDQELVHTVSRETGGNPLFVVAVADAIGAGEDVCDRHTGIDAPTRHSTAGPPRPSRPCTLEGGGGPGR